MRGLVRVTRVKTAPTRAAKATTAKKNRGGPKAAATRSQPGKAAGIKAGARATDIKGAAKKRVAKQPTTAVSRKGGSTEVSARHKPVAKDVAPKAARGTRPVARGVVPKNAAPIRPTARTVAPKEPPGARPAEARPPGREVDQAARDKELAREHAATAVNRALSLLETLARTGPVPLAVLADAAGCGKTAAFELLTTMQTRNFIIQDEVHGLWRLGARWAVLGSAASEQGALAATAMPYLAALGNATGENVYLRVREGMESETVAIYQTDPGLRVYTEVGKKMPLHAGSGRVLLAHAPEAVQTQVLAQRLQRYTPSTRTDPSWIAADLHRIRTRGFLITDSEVVAGTVSVCCPVRDASGQVVASILIGAPSLRMRPPRPRALMPAVVEAARKLSHALGSISEQPAPTNGSAETHAIGAFSSPAWPATALGAAISRPHSVFR
jgi:DNA-binding IclR family transcriptional regulator